MQGRVGADKAAAARDYAVKGKVVAVTVGDNGAGETGDQIACSHIPFLQAADRGHGVECATRNEK